MTDHNQTSQAQGNWTIALSEYPLPIPLNRSGMTPPFGHSFLILKNPEGEIVNELHGVCFLPKKDWYAPTTFMSIIDAMVGSLRHGLDIDNSYLKIASTKGPSKLTLRNTQTVTDLASGSYDDILPRWISAMESGLEINALDMKYVPFSLSGKDHHGQNCHTVSYAFAKAMGTATPAYKFKAPGRTTPILEGLRDTFRMQADPQTAHERNLEHLLDRIDTLATELIETRRVKKAPIHMRQRLGKQQQQPA